MTTKNVAPEAGVLREFGNTDEASAMCIMTSKYGEVHQNLLFRFIGHVGGVLLCGSSGKLVNVSGAGLNF